MLIPLVIVYLKSMLIVDFGGCVRHNVIDKPDPHKLQEIQNLNAQIELDEEIERIR